MRHDFPDKARNPLPRPKRKREKLVNDTLSSLRKRAAKYGGWGIAVGSGLNPIIGHVPDWVWERGWAWLKSWVDSW
jgi:hypothetical protein